MAVLRVTQYNLLTYCESKQMKIKVQPRRSSSFLSNQQKLSKQTRNPTTQKKIEEVAQEFKRTTPFQVKQSWYESLRRRGRSQAPYRGQSSRHCELQIMRLSVKLRKCTQSRKYEQAKKISQKLKNLQKTLLNIKTQQLIESQKREKRSVSEAHKHYMQYFNLAWHRYFATLDKRERNIFQALRQDQERQIIKAQRRTRERCRSRSTSREVIQLQNKQLMLQKTGDYDYLKEVKQQLKKAITKDKQKRISIMQQISWLEQDRVRASLSKKYNALVERLSQNRKDKEGIYLREQRRLRQKYKNVMGKLEHQHKQELMFLDRGLDLQP